MEEKGKTTSGVLQSFQFQIGVLPLFTPMDQIGLLTEVPFNMICVRQLPADVTRHDMARIFGVFGTTSSISIKRRVAKDSATLLRNPFAILTFDKADSVDQVMAHRPFSLGPNLLAVRRFLPVSARSSTDPHFPVKKILIRTQSDQDEERLPDNAFIDEYLRSVGGTIEYFERLDEKTILVQFDDYDPVDLCCMMAPHQINNQPIRIERCLDENQARREVELRAK